MNSQPQAGVLIELCLARIRISINSGREQALIRVALRGRGIGIHYRLDHASRAENRGWSERQDVFGCATFSFISFTDHGAACFELVDVMLENRLRERNESGDVVVSGAGTRFDVSQVGRGAGFRSQTEEEEIDAAERFKTFDVADQIAFEIFGISAHGGEAVHLAKEIFAQQSLEVADETQAV